MPRKKKITTMKNASNSRYRAIKRKEKETMCCRNEDDRRDEDCIMIENTEARKGIENNISFARNTINTYHGNVHLNFNGDYFKFIDVPGDGDCFYHSVLKYHNLQEKFNCVQQLIIYLRDMVYYLFSNDPMIQNLFTH